MTRHDARPRIPAALLFVALAATNGPAFAQTPAGPSPDVPAAAAAPAPATPVAPAQYPPQPYGVVAPPPPGVPLGGGNATESSAQPEQGEREDNFDFGKSESSGTSYGDANGPIDIGNQPSRVIGSAGVVAGATVPGIHTVRRGDTLWGICDQYFQNPYQWPRIWSYNPQLQNPHWIYPGDQIRLQGGNLAESGGGGARTAATSGSGGLLAPRRSVSPDTVFLRDEGYVEDESKENWGEISGAPADHMLLSDFDEVYLRVSRSHDVELGQELTVFRPTRELGTGAIVQIEGTVRVNQWDAKDRIARAQIVESLDAIERGARIGPIRRRFDVVPPVRNESDVTARVMASVRLHEFFGQNQVVFIDRGAEDGLKVGNRLFIVHRGDAWRATMPTDVAAMRIAIESRSPAEIERVPRPRDEAKFPEQVIGELRVLAMHPHSATCLLTQSVSEVELGDTAVARKGY